MTDKDLANRLEELFASTGMLREELEWLTNHGLVRTWEPGVVVASKGKRIETLWIILSGHIAIRVDRGAGPRRVMEWRTGDVGGVLPYSRMIESPGDSYSEEKTQILHIHKDHFPEMINRCPVFTAHTVHIMLDRARSFNTSDLQDEKMISLGKLAAGLAHELNNPASATLRNAKLLLENLKKVDTASRALGAADFTDEMMKMIDQVGDLCIEKPRSTILSPLEQADREDEIADWLLRRHLDPDYAAALAETSVTIETLDSLANGISSDNRLDPVIRWVAEGCLIRSLAKDIEQAVTRIHKIVEAVRNFTYMDKLAGPDSVDIESGLRETILIVASKARSKKVTITLDIEPDLPRAYATGGELNQVWLNLIDNALDAVSESGRIDIHAYQKLDRIVVCVIDDGPGISPDNALRIFDPFFTTKPPGQGTGLGLDITWRLLRRYHGDISFDSHPGRTVFRVSLLVDKTENVVVTGPPQDTVS